MSRIDLSKNKFFQNLDLISKILGNKNKICLVLKDNAYGHGLKEISKLANDYGISRVYVKNDYEANSVSQLDFEEVIILNSDKKKFINKNISVVVNSSDELYSLSPNSKIHLKIDTGLGRNGISPNKINDTINFIITNNIIIAGVLTHFRSSDEEDNFIYEQEELFLNFIKKIKSKIKYNFNIHCGNSHSITKINPSKYDFFRVGIMAYGYSYYQNFKLFPVLSLYSKKISTRTLKKGNTIGYGSTSFIVKQENLTVSSYDIGYGDGFFRLDEHKKYMLPNGKYILGRVSMDCLTVEGDENEILIFKDARKLSEIHDTIVYEILVALKSNIERKIV